MAVKLVTLYKHVLIDSETNRYKFYVVYNDKTEKCLGTYELACDEMVTGYKQVFSEEQKDHYDSYIVSSDKTETHLGCFSDLELKSVEGGLTWVTE